MRRSLLPILLGLSLLYVQVVTAYDYSVFISTTYGGTTDKVSIILVGQGGTQTGVHDLPGEFYAKSVRRFAINDPVNVGAISAVKIRLVQKGLWQDYWYLRQVRQQPHDNLATTIMVDSKPDRRYPNPQNSES
ncbi:hypothetical protein OS493_029643 [Desmophyllum pertusum]|uniref:PLAT domain-containing protein n=1 Tax=Desmophyllum pertusum TaxID=174260 RepID=A0A9W9ZYF7_9CNID|nr:hypothetical protein OS493_029643 [Desmophyllum pertusum]